MGRRPRKDSLFDESAPHRPCDMPGCAEPGHFRAPKSRDSLREYHWFCLEHVRAYNAKWDFFAGMSADAIEDHIRKATTWDRPTWRTQAGWDRAHARVCEEVIREFRFAGGEAPHRAQAETHDLPPQERAAYATLGLAPGLEFEAIKARYKELVKQHHPDLNGGCRDAEERLKSITHAFTILKSAHRQRAAA